MVASSSEEETVVTNGMSEYARDGENANAALVVSVDASDFGSGVLDGVAFQRRLERQAFVLGGKDYRAPAQSVKSYLEAAAPDLSQAATTPVSYTHLDVYKRQAAAAGDNRIQRGCGGGKRAEDCLEF